MLRSKHGSLASEDVPISRGTDSRSKHLREMWELPCTGVTSPLEAKSLLGCNFRISPLLLRKSGAARARQGN